MSHQVDEFSYKGSGYDRGHMCPAGDNKWSHVAMSESFLMSNICPQNHELNQLWWEHLEEAERRWALKEGLVYICCGPIFCGGSTFIGNDPKIEVPDAFFKVILSLRKGKEKAIGFIYQNNSTKQTMRLAVRSVDQIEELTGYDFFHELPDKIENMLESESRIDDWD